VGALTASATAVGAIAFLARQSFTRFLNREAERFKYTLGVDAKTRELLLRSQIEFKERQLSEFYGPIYAYLKRGEPIISLWKDGRLYEVEDEMRTLFKAANEDMVRIILTKSHLVRGPTIPKLFTQYLTHVAVWHAYLNTSHKTLPFPREEFPEAFFPEEFVSEVVQTTEALKRELDDLYKRYGVEVDPAAADVATEVKPAR